MGALQELERARGEVQARRPPKGRGRSVIVLSAATILAFAGVLIWLAARGGGNAGTPVGPVAGQPADLGPAFTAGNFTAWNDSTVTNLVNDPLVISRVSVNGESDATKAGKGQQKETPLPVTLTVGETCWFTRDQYPKRTVYIDFYTNRGTFRFRPGAGFVKE